MRDAFTKTSCACFEKTQHEVIAPMQRLPDASGLALSSNEAAIPGKSSRKRGRFSWGDCEGVGEVAVMRKSMSPALAVRSSVSPEMSVERVHVRVST